MQQDKHLKFVGYKSYFALIFDKDHNATELTGFNLQEKNIIYELLINYGVPVNKEGKNDYVFLKNQLQEKIDEETQQ